MAEAPEKVRALLLEPSAVGDDNSHVLANLIGISHTLEHRGVEVSWATHRRFDRALAAGREVYRVFRHTAFDDFHRFGRFRIPDFAQRLRAPALVARAGRDLEETLERADLNASDHLVVPAVDWPLFGALNARYGDRGSRPGLPTLHLRFFYESANWMTGGYPYARMTSALKTNDWGAVHLYTETQAHARRLDEATGRSVAPIPHPALPLADSINALIDHDGLCVGLLGAGRRDKGFAQLPDIVEQTRLLAGQARHPMFLVQGARPQEPLREVEAALQACPEVKLLAHNLDAVTYAAALRSCDLIALPYNPDVYRERGSGIVNEALANAIPIVCPANTSLEESIRDGNGLAARPGEFPACLVQACSQIATLKAAAVNARERYLNALLNNALVGNVLESPARPPTNPRLAI